MKSQLSNAQKIIKKSLLDQKLCPFEVQWRYCYSPLKGLIMYGRDLGGTIFVFLPQKIFLGSKS